MSKENEAAGSVWTNLRVETVMSIGYPQVVAGDPPSNPQVIDPQVQVDRGKQVSAGAGLISMDTQVTCQVMTIETVILYMQMLI